jgi:hypothetical protein
MSDETGNRFERLETLRKAAWESFTTRRKDEWKVNLSLWGVLAAFTVGSLSGKWEFAGSPSEIMFVVLLPMSLLILHLFWLSRLSRANRLDKAEEGDFRTAMCLEIDHKFSDPLVEKLRRERAEDGALSPWAPLPQFITTSLLVALATYPVPRAGT